MRGEPERPIGTHTRKRITISDVSDALGLTKSTVSRALNDYPDISDSTRLRVRRMAENMGYRPLSHAQAIKTGLTKSLGLVIQLADHDSHRPFLAEFLAGLSQGASAQGWTLTIAASDSPTHTIETMQTMIGDRKVDGFILPRAQVDDERVAFLRAAGVPFVLFGRSPDPTGCAWFDVLGEDAMRDAVEHLAGLGHRHIGFINGGARYTYSRLRHEGFLAAMEGAGLYFDASHMCDEAVTIQAGKDAGHRILMAKTPPTAIICAVDMAALGVYRAAADLGVAIGTDLSVISYDGIPEGAYATPQLSTFAVDFTESGKRLSTLLIRRIRGEAPEDLRETVRPVFLNRGSAGPPAKSSRQLAQTIARHTK